MLSHSAGYVVRQVLVLNSYQVLMISRQHCWQRFSQGNLEIPGWVVVVPIVV